jgi:hypothetical protein
VEGGVTVILTLFILFGAIAGGVALFGAGGWIRRREIEDTGDEGSDERPVHTVVENETGDVQHPRRPSDPPPPPE